MTTIYCSAMVLLVVVSTVTAKPNGCCTSDQLSCDIVYAGKTQYRLSIDFVANMVLEDYGGNDGIDFLLGDDNAGVIYQRMVTGECKKYPITEARYRQCKPQEAVYTEVAADSGIQLDGFFRYEDDGTGHLMVVRRGSCDPYRLHLTKKDKTQMIYFINFVHKVDSSVFNKDISDCVDA